jgi:hypothetical protein
MREDDPDAKFAVRGDESHESPETLSPDERDAAENQPLPGPPAEPKQPAPKR